MSNSYYFGSKDFQLGTQMIYEAFGSDYRREAETLRDIFSFSKDISEDIIVRRNDDIIGLSYRNSRFACYISYNQGQWFIKFANQDKQTFIPDSCETYKQMLGDAFTNFVGNEGEYEIYYDMFDYPANGGLLSITFCNPVIDNAWHDGFDPQLILDKLIDIIEQIFDNMTYPYFEDMESLYEEEICIALRFYYFADVSLQKIGKAYFIPEVVISKNICDSINHYCHILGDSNNTGHTADITEIITDFEKIVEEVAIETNNVFWNYLYRRNRKLFILSRVFVLTIRGDDIMRFVQLQNDEGMTVEENRNINQELNLKHQILEVVENSNGIKARDIAQQLGVTRRQVNQTLTYQLQNECYKDESHLWHITVR